MRISDWMSDVCSSDLVIPETCSVAHAEMMAFMIAQQRSQQFRLNAIGGPITLASSAQPCCMCYGATFWAGIDRLLIGARASDVMALTEFDEGDRKSTSLNSSH